MIGYCTSILLFKKRNGVKSFLVFRLCPHPPTTYPQAVPSLPLPLLSPKKENPISPHTQTSRQGWQPRQDKRERHAISQEKRGKAWKWHPSSNAFCNRKMNNRTDKNKHSWTSKRGGTKGNIRERRRRNREGMLVLASLSGKGERSRWIRQKRED